MNIVRLGTTLLAYTAALAALVWAPSLLMAAPMLYEIAPDGNGTTEGRAITPDGKYVVGLGYVEAAEENRGFFWDANNGSRQVLDTGNTLAGQLVGVGYRTYNSNKEIVAFGRSTAGPWASYYITLEADAATGTETWGPKLRRYPDYSNINLPASNAVSGSSLQADAWYDTYQNSNGEQFWVEMGQGAPTLENITRDQKSTGAEARMQGVSSTGLAVGWRKVEDVPRNYVSQYVGGGQLSPYWPNGLRADAGGGENREGQLWAIAAYSDASDNRAGGMSPVDGDANETYWPFILDDFTGSDTGTATELPTLDPNTAVVNTLMGIVYGLSADGRYAVGMDYTLGNELAVLWDLADLDNIVEIDLTQYAIDNGILGEFGGNLRRAYAVGVNGAGEPVVTGWGYNNVEEAVRGYVLQLELGGLILGDVNGDGQVNDLDVDPFLNVLLNGPFNPAADMTGDGLVNGLDVERFVAAVSGGGTQAVAEPSTLAIVAIGLFCLLAHGRRRRGQAAY